MEFLNPFQLVLIGLLDLICLLSLVGLVYDLYKSRALVYAQCTRLVIWCLVCGNAITLTVCTAIGSEYDSFIRIFTISMSLAFINTYECFTLWAVSPIAVSKKFYNTCSSFAAILFSSTTLLASSPAFGIQYPAYHFVTLILSAFLALQFVWTYRITKLLLSSSSSSTQSKKLGHDRWTCLILAILTLAVFIVGLVIEKTWISLNLILCVITACYSLRRLQILLRMFNRSSVSTTEENLTNRSIGDNSVSISIETSQTSNPSLQFGERPDAELGGTVYAVHEAREEGNEIFESKIIVLFHQELVTVDYGDEVVNSNRIGSGEP